MRVKILDSNEQTGAHSDHGKTIGRIENMKQNEDINYSWTIYLVDGETSKITTGSCDDRSEEIILSSRMAEEFIIDGIGRTKRVTPWNCLKPWSQSVKHKYSVSLAHGHAHALSFICMQVLLLPGIKHSSFQINTWRVRTFWLDCLSYFIYRFVERRFWNITEKGSMLPSEPK